MTQYDWILGQPVQTNNTNYEWVLGQPYILHEHTAAGADIKTINGLALASVKTYNGLAIASVKTINGASLT